MTQKSILFNDISTFVSDNCKIIQSLLYKKSSCILINAFIAPYEKDEMLIEIALFWYLKLAYSIHFMNDYFLPSFDT